MNKTTEIGDLGKAIIIADATKRGYNVSLPMSDGLRYDLIVERNGNLEKVQVKTVGPVSGTLPVPTKTMVYSKDKTGNNRSKMLSYTVSDFDWLAVVNSDTHDCYYIPVSEVAKRKQYNLRLVKPKNNQTKNIHLASSFKKW